MDKNVILARLAAGETLQAIGDEFAAMMNAAADEYNEAKRKEAETAAAKAAAEAKLLAEKRSLANDFVVTLQKYCALCGVDPSLLGDVELDEVDLLVEAMDELIGLMKMGQELKEKLGALAPTAAPVQLKGATPRIIPLELNDTDILNAFKATL